MSPIIGTRERRLKRQKAMQAAAEARGKRQVTIEDHELIARIETLEAQYKIVAQSNVKLLKTQTILLNGLVAIGKALKREV